MSRSVVALRFVKRTRPVTFVSGGAFSTASRLFWKPIAPSARIFGFGMRGIVSFSASVAGPCARTFAPTCLDIPPSALLFA